MSTCRIEDLPPQFQDQVRKKLAAETARRTPTPCEVAPRKARVRPGSRNEAEAATILEGIGLTIQDRQYKVSLGAEHVYTADLLVRGIDSQLYIVEVKGSYRHGSVGRSRLAFDTARLRTGMGGLWVEKRKASRGKAAHWKIEVYASNGAKK